MKVIMIGLTALTLGASQAGAQDWSGNWGGLSLGYGSGTYQQGDDDLAEIGPDVDVNGVIVGLQLARNYQQGNVVYGFDVSVSQGPSGITAEDTTSAPDWNCNTGDCNIDIKSLITMRGRYGFLVSPETLAYGAGGLAVGNIEGGIFNSAQQGSSTAVGFTIGAGVERMFGENRTFFGEVNYVDLGKLDFGTAGSPTDIYDAVGDFVTVKIGVNFRF